MPLFEGTPQPWVLFFSNGLERCNSLHDLLNNRVKIFDYPAVDIHSQDFWLRIDEEVTEGSHKFWLNTLKWIEPLIAAAIKEENAGDSAAAAAQHHAKMWWDSFKQLDTDWNDDPHIWGGHCTALRTTSLVALTEVAADADWLHEALQLHADHLKQNFDGYWNHGLVQSIALEAAGARLSRKEASEVARRRILDCLDVMVDSEGCINEQAPEYARYIANLTQTCIQIFESNGLAGLDQLQKKWTSLTEFIAHSLQPDLTFVALGDSRSVVPALIPDSPVEYVLSHGQRGPKIPTTAFYKGGFIFGRSGFGDRRPIQNESYYSVRFGPGRIIHGHNDHMSITYWAEGRHLIVDPGHVGYEPGSDRDYVRSAEAHNVVLIEGEKHHWDRSTSAEVIRRTGHWQAYRLTDQAYENFKRVRTALFTNSGPVVVADQVKGSGQSRYLAQSWNLSNEFQFQSSNKELKIFTSALDGSRLVAASYLVDAGENEVAVPSFDFFRGSVNPMAGWVANRNSLRPTTQIRFGVRAESACIVTTFFVVPPNDTFGCSYRLGKEYNSLRISVGERYWRINHYPTTGELNATTTAPAKVNFPDRWRL